MPAIPELPPISHLPLSVILLDREPGSADQFLPGWLTFLEGRKLDFELLLITLPGQSPTVQHARLRIEQCASGPGEGALLRTGLGLARHPLIFYTLCQADYRPEELGRLLDLPLPSLEPGMPSPGKAIDHVHLLGGYRAGTPVPLPIRVVGGIWRGLCWLILAYGMGPLPGWLGWRRHLGWVLARFFFGVRYQDVACPFRLFRREVLARSPLQSDSSFAHVELLAKVNFLGFLLGEDLPLPIKPPQYRGDGLAIWKDGRKVFDRPDFGPAVLPGTTA